MPRTALNETEREKVPIVSSCLVSCGLFCVVNYYDIDGTEAEGRGWRETEQM